MEVQHEKWIAAVAAACAAAMAKVPELVWLLIGAQVVDMITGMLVAWNAGKLCSTVARKGITKKSVMLMLVAVGFALDRVLGSSLPVGTAVAGYYAAMELLSVTENAGKLGLPVAPAIRRGLAALNKETDRDQPDKQ